MSLFNNNVQVGQEVAVQGSYRVLFDFRVNKVTPSGQIIVERVSDAYTMRFDRNGYEMGTSVDKFRRNRLITDVAARREEARRGTALTAAAAAVLSIVANPRCNSQWGAELMRDELARLEILIITARAAINAVEAAS